MWSTTVSLKRNGPLFCKTHGVPTKMRFQRRCLYRIISFFILNSRFPCGVTVDNTLDHPNPIFFLIPGLLLNLMIPDKLFISPAVV